MEKTEIPHTRIRRYPVVARWRPDVDFVAAGIFCFQPYCVTGELEPPANPLICPQFCLRFNDLDNIGLSGRHYSGFIMQGMQVFNSPDNYVYFKDEVVDYNLKWLIEDLKVDPDEITLIEDVWAGGGNMGPSIEYFIGGLEVGNMVFMQYKTYPDGSRQELQVQVIDVGIGLERVAWLLNGSATSYITTFPSALARLKKATGIDYEDNPIWNKFGPYSCRLNLDEVDDIEEVWGQIAAEIGEEVNTVKDAIAPIRDMYIVCDHTRSLVVAIEDGALPSNVGGASNLRNILRRVFALLHDRKHADGKSWMEHLTMDGLMDVFAAHKTDLTPLYGEFQEYKSLREIIELEYDRWQRSAREAKQALVQIQSKLKKKKKEFGMEEWIHCVTSLGLPPDVVSGIVGVEVPGNLYHEIAQREEKSAKQQLKQLYDTAHMTQTVELFYKDDQQEEMDAKIVEIVANVSQDNAFNIVVTDETVFYPTSGGQQHDTGKLTIDGTTYDVVDALKVGKVIFHVLDKALPDEPESYKGKAVHGAVDMVRRAQLRNHHTATHIVCAAAREVLGPHVWQNGAKKTIKEAHLDITHYKSLTQEQELKIEQTANRIANHCVTIEKFYMRKEDAEKQYGFSLYQGGIVPGNELRVVDIKGVDTEACCGTHCDNTGEVGSIRLLKTSRISDGIVRLTFYAGERALEHTGHQTTIMRDLCNQWSVEADDLNSTGARFFGDSKKLNQTALPQLIALQVKVFALSDEKKGVIRTTLVDNSSKYQQIIQRFAQDFKDKQKTLVVVGPPGDSTFIAGFVGATDPAELGFDYAKIKAHCDETNAKLLGAEEAAGVPDAAAFEKKKKKAAVNERREVSFKKKEGKKNVTVKVDGILEFTSKTLNSDGVMTLIQQDGFVDVMSI